MYGAIRAERDLLSSQPDIVVIEFAVNDNWTDGEAFEGLVRQVVAQPNSPATMLLFMMWEKGGNDQEMQSKVGAHYKLPMISFRDAIWPEIQAGRLAWSEYIADNVHPTDIGHAAAARFIVKMFDKALNTDATDGFDPSTPLPPPLYDDAFQHIRWRNADALDPIHNDGWHRPPDANNIAAWTGAKSSGRITFEWTGSGVVAVLAEPPRELADIQFSIDGAALRTLDVLKQPKRQLFVLAQNLPAGSHTVSLACSTPNPNSSMLTPRLLGLASLGQASIGFRSSRT
jgi:hypothetical protein